MESNTKKQEALFEAEYDLIYVASPYSHQNKEVESVRYGQVADFVQRHLKEGRLVYSPIVYAHALALRHALPTSAEWWWLFNKRMVEKCDRMWVLCLNGWENSRGVRDEIEYAKIIGKPVKMFSP